MFPFAMRTVESKNWKRAFHIGEVIFVHVTTCIAPTYILITSKFYPYGYPPNLCIPNATFTFYTVVLPVALLICIGTCLIVLMFWRLQVVSMCSYFKPWMNIIALCCEKVFVEFYRIRSLQQ